MSGSETFLAIVGGIAVACVSIIILVETISRLKGVWGWTLDMIAWHTAGRPSQNDIEKFKSGKWGYNNPDRNLDGSMTLNRMEVDVMQAFILKIREKAALDEVMFAYDFKEWVDDEDEDEDTRIEKASEYAQAFQAKLDRLTGTKSEMRYK